MVQFAAKLRANKVPKWEEDYVDYDGLKRLIKRIVKALKQQQQTLNVPSVINYHSSDAYSDTEDFNFHGSEDENLLRGHEHAYDDNEDVHMAVLGNGNGNRNGHVSHYGAIQIPLDGNSSKEEFSVDAVKEFDLRIINEAKRVQEFYQRHLDECKFQIEKLQEAKPLSRGRRNRNLVRDRATFESIKWACIEVYRRLNELHSYTILNYTAFVKIIKKHDKATGLKKKKELMQIVHQYKSGFCDAPDLLEQMNIMENFVAELFYRGNVVQARSELLAKYIPTSSWEMMHTGMRFGILIVLFLWVLWNVVTEIRLIPGSEATPSEVIQVYRSVGVFLLCFWCWTAVIYFWNTARVNYTYLFEFDPRHQYSFNVLLNKSSTMTILYLSNILIYYKIKRGEVFGFDAATANYLPLIMLAATFMFMIFPISETYGIYSVLSRVIFAPFYEVTFWSAFVADILTSLVRPLVDFSYSLCFYLSGSWKQYFHEKGSFNAKTQQPVRNCQDMFWFSRIFIPLLISLPLFFRFLQNIRRYHDTRKRFPHLANAGKYALAHVLVLLGAIYPALQHSTKTESDAPHRFFHIIWALTFAASTLFTYCWDVFVDWGLGFKEDHFLRKQRMFSVDWFYYTAMVVDLFLRFSWCVTLVPSISNFFGQDYAMYLTLLFAVVEILRRTMWSLIRVEYEHLYNTQGYRRVEYVPLHFDPPSEEEDEDRSKPKWAVIVELTVFVLLTTGISFMALVNPPDDY